MRQRDESSARCIGERPAALIESTNMHSTERHYGHFRRLDGRGCLQDPLRVKRWQIRTPCHMPRDAQLTCRLVAPWTVVPVKTCPIPCQKVPKPLSRCAHAPVEVCPCPCHGVPKPLSRDKPWSMTSCPGKTPRLPVSAIFANNRRLPDSFHVYTTPKLYCHRQDSVTSRTPVATRFWLPKTACHFAARRN